MSLAETTSCDSPPMAWPICWLNIAPPIWLSIPIIGPAIACASAGIAAPIAATTLSATGSTSRCHVGMLASTHSARLHATTVAARRREVGDAVEPVLGKPGDVAAAGPRRRRRRAVGRLRHDLPGQVAGVAPS